MRTLTVSFMAIYLGLSSHVGLAGENISVAQRLFEQGKFLESVKLLNRNTENEIYLIWKNESAIGVAAQFCQVKKFCDYVKRNKDYFYYYEPGGEYFTTDKRLKEIQAINSKSPYAMEIEYVLLIEEENTSGEYYDDYVVRARDLLKLFREFLGRYPDTKYRAAIEGRIKEYEKVKPAKNCKGMIVHGICVNNKS